MSALDHPLYEQPWPDGDFRLFQIGLLVEDLLGAAARWAKVFGVGPFHVLPIVEQRVTLHGEPSSCSVQVAVAQAGPVQIELIQQHCNRPSIYREWLGGRSAGVHQLCTVSRDYEGKRAHYLELGYELAAESISAPFRIAYFDTAADFGFYTEVVEHTDGFLAQVHGIAETCRAWDGNDPVRLLTRDGYRVPDRP